MADQRVMYGVTIHDAIKRGDQTELRSLLSEARAALTQAGDLTFAVLELENVLKGHRPPGHMFYGVVVHDAIKRGNATELQSLLSDAQSALKEQGDLNAAINDLQAALKKSGK
ncbi:MAG TPA: DUF1843 domain-containing protein [Thermoanaerobaculia bacterium]|nr:DUF1843 domain-containing protein [Thermoanaerobaculia bacterium]